MNHWIWITSGFAMAIASAACGLAQAKAVAAACEGMARNPSAAASIRFALILGLALIESLALYTLVIILLQVRAT
jgi:F-type H+-transporting ATPase subunit c